MFPKTKRTKDRKLLDKYQGMPCIICATRATTVAHHIKTKGSGGPDERWNLMPLCYTHHDEIHRSTVDFASKYKNAALFLERLGWFFDSYSGEWNHPNLSFNALKP